MAERGPAVPHRAGVEWREGNRSDSPRAGGERRSDRRPPEPPSSERRERGWRRGWESNPPLDTKCRGDDFEDRDDHQARITLRPPCYRASSNGGRPSAASVLVTRPSFLL